MNIEKIKIQRETGETVVAQAPVIISASRSTDIPAFYADWFFHRLKIGYSAWINPYNGMKSYISYQNTRLIVFWSKNPEPLLPYLNQLKEQGINCYIQYTLNDYESDNLEKGVPAIETRVQTFHRLVDKLGYGKVIWRFDPLILTERITVDDLLQKIEYIGDKLKGYTEKLVFSFADITSYRKVKYNLEHNNILYREFNESSMEEFATRLALLNKRWGYTLATCGEKIDLERFGIQHNRCIDDELMIKYFSDDKLLMKHLGVDIQEGGVFEHPQVVHRYRNKDQGQRLLCGCITSKDIGEYNTCPHQCEYCYANTTKELGITNWKNHQKDSHGETITGR